MKIEDTIGYKLARKYPLEKILAICQKHSLVLETFKSNEHDMSAKTSCKLIIDAAEDEVCLTFDGYMDN